MKAYLTVGEMGRMFGLNVQTLHYYDKIGLFCPQLRDPEPGRRRYKFDQVYQLATIRFLRKLGYPLEDVVGFIRHRGKCFTCCGCWKSYGDPAAARQHFDQLAKCTAVYLRLFHSGTPILKLAVAA